MVIRYNLHGLFNLLMALILKALAVAILASIDTATKVVILRGWRWGPKMDNDEYDHVSNVSDASVHTCRHLLAPRR